MSATPAIPEWIRRFKHPGYTNVFSFLPTCPRLYGTETLFGDWDAPVLLLAKDGAPTHVIRALAAQEGNGAWRHAQQARGDKGGFKTNQRLAELARQIPGPKLYGSATAHMVYDDPGWSRSLPDFREGRLHDHLARVLAWVMDSMPHLRAIACLGEESWFLTSVVLDQAHAARQWTIYRDSARHIRGTDGRRKVIAAALYHPGARVSTERMNVGWQELAAAIAAKPPGLLSSLARWRPW